MHEDILAAFLSKDGEIYENLKAKVVKRFDL